MSVDPSVLGKALGGRLTEIEAAIERYGAFAFAPGQEHPPPALAEGEGTPATRALVLRALAAASDPLNYRLLERLVEGDTPLATLAGVVGEPRLAVWARISDLVAAGLAGRDLEGDTAGLTAAGRFVVELVEEAARAGGGR